MSNVEILQHISDRKARASFEPRRVGSGYKLDCGDPSHLLGLWDYRQNALNKGYAHARIAHGLSSERTEWAAEKRLFAEPQAAKWP